MAYSDTFSFFQDYNASCVVEEPKERVNETRTNITTGRLLLKSTLAPTLHLSPCYCGMALHRVKYTIYITAMKIAKTTLARKLHELYTRIQSKMRTQHTTCRE